MTRAIYDIYGSRAQGSGPNWPEGTFKDETAPGMENGTPVQGDWAKQFDAPFQRIRKEGHITLNGIIDNVPNCQTWQALLAYFSQTAPPQATPQQICAGMPETDWADPAAAPNYLDTGEYIRDACVGYDPSTSEHFLWIVHADETVRRVTGAWKYGSAPSLGAVTFNWITTPDDILAVCSDATHLYVAWRETGGTVHISKFSVSEWTGNELFYWDTGVYAYASSGTKMCIASDDYLGFLIPEETGGDNRVRIGSILKNSVTISSDFFNGHSVELVSAKIISDGTYLYTIGADMSGAPSIDYSLLRAEITDPTQQAVISYGATSVTQYKPTSIQRVKGLIILTTMSGRVFAYNPSAGNILQLFADLDFSFYDSGFLYGTAMGSDGTNLFVFVSENDENGTGYYSVFKIPIGQFLWEAKKTIESDLKYTRTRIVEFSASLLASQSNYLLFDRRDMWLVINDGQIYRICNPGG